MCGVDVDRPVADHHRIAVDSPLRPQPGELLPLVHAGVSAADELEAVAQPEVDQDALGEDRQLRRADAQHRAAVAQGVEHGGNAVVQHVLRIADVGISLAIAREQLAQVRRVVITREEGERLVQGRPDEAGQGIERTFGVAESRQRMVDRPADALQRIAQGAVEIEHDHRMNGASFRGGADGGGHAGHRSILGPPSIPAPVVRHGSESPDPGSPASRQPTGVSP